MKKFLIPATAVILVLTAAAGGALALTSGGDDEDDSAVRDTTGQERCAAGATSCDDPNSIDEGEDGAVGDENSDPFAICAEGATDCVDTPTNGDEPVTSDPNSGGGVDPSECSLTHNLDACQEQAVALAKEDLASRIGAESDLISAEYVDWPDTSLGNPQGEMFYAQVITPGYKIILEAGGARYEYHTDLADNFTLLD